MSPKNNAPVPNDVHKPFQALEKDLRTVLFERREEIHTAVLAILGRQHHFVLGAPGTAKSFMVDQLVKRIDGASKFSVVLNRFSQPEEIFGGPNVKELAESGVFERVTTGMLPEADIAFLDEIFKANAAILNAMLRAMNERQFVRGAGLVCDIPLHTLFAASNELAESDELKALWDRLHYRHYTSPLQESSNFIKMLGLSTPTPRPLITMDQIHEANKLVKTVEIPEDVFSAIITLKSQLLNENIEVSDRRWREAVTSIRSEAFYQGSMIANVDDMRQLMHFLWNEPDQMKIVRRLVLELANPLEREAAELLDSITEVHETYSKKVNDAENNSAKAALAVEVFKKLDQTKDSFRKLKARQAKTGRESDIMDQLGDKISAVASHIMEALALQDND